MYIRNTVSSTLALDWLTGLYNIFIWKTKQKSGIPFLPITVQNSGSLLLCVKKSRILFRLKNRPSTKMLTRKMKNGKHKNFSFCHCVALKKGFDFNFLKHVVIIYSNSTNHEVLIFIIPNATYFRKTNFTSYMYNI